MLSAACASSSEERAASTSSSATVRGAIVGMPFDGYLNRFAGTADDTSPRIHHRVVGGNWATDLYAPAGTLVWYREQTGAVARVAAMTSACAAAGPTLGGWQIQVDVSSSSGAYLGSVFYLHVGAPRVSVGQIIGDATVLGETVKWSPSACYAVNTDSGVHVHFEVRSGLGGSCWAYESGFLGGYTGIARIGAGDATGPCGGPIDVAHDDCAGLIDSFYCGGHRVSGDPSTLYQCRGGVRQPFERACTSGCVQVATADPDRCGEDPSSACVCDGVDQDGNPVHSETCGATVCGLDRRTWTCTPGNWSGGGPPC